MHEIYNKIEIVVADSPAPGRCPSGRVPDFASGCPSWGNLGLSIPERAAGVWELCLCLCRRLCMLTIRLSPREALLLTSSCVFEVSFLLFGFDQEFRNMRRATVGTESHKDEVR